MRFALILCCLAVLSGKPDAQVAIIAHKDVPVDTLTQPQLLDFYTGDVKRWKNKKVIVAFMLKPRTAVQDSFFKLLGRTSSRMKSIWMKNMLSGEGDPPESLDSEADIFQRVAATPGAIGFVTRDSLNNRVNVKILQIKKGKDWPLF